MEVAKGDGSRLRAKVEAMGRQECQKNRARLLSPRERGGLAKLIKSVKEEDQMETEGRIKAASRDICT